MPQTPTRRRLVSALAACFKRGFELDESALYYIASTLGDPSAALLDAVAADEDHPERDVLLMMVFTPSPRVQAGLEPLLEAGAFDRRDEQALVRELAAKSTPTHFSLPGQKGKWYLTPPKDAVAHFIGQLHITRALDKSLRHAIDTRVNRQTAAAVKVMFRNSRLSPDEQVRTFFERFFKAVGDTDPDFTAALTFMIDFFESSAENRPLVEALLKRRQFYTRALRKTRKHQAHLAERNFETLMLQGIKPVYCDVQQALRNITLIDRICESVYHLRIPQGEDALYLALGEDHDASALGKPFDSML